MNPYEGDPSIFEKDGSYYHKPRSFWLKLLYLIAGFGVLSVGINDLWGPAGRAFYGLSGDARVVRIEKVIPGAKTEVYRYRRDFADERDRSITFQHYVAVEENGQERVMRLGVDSRVKPYANVNDVIEVAYYEDDAFAFAKWHARSWGMGIFYAVIGFSFVATGVPMLFAVGRPILIDPESEEPPGEPSDQDEAAAEEDADGDGDGDGELVEDDTAK